MSRPTSLETTVAAKIVARAKRLGGPGDGVVVGWSPYNHGGRQGVQWQATVALLPPRTRGRYVSAWGTSPYDALTALDRITVDRELIIEGARAQEVQS